MSVTCHAGMSVYLKCLGCLDTSAHIHSGLKTYTLTQETLSYPITRQSRENEFCAWLIACCDVPSQ